MKTEKDTILRKNPNIENSEDSSDLGKVIWAAEIFCRWNNIFLRAKWKEAKYS